MADSASSSPGQSSPRTPCAPIAEEHGIEVAPEVIQGEVAAEAVFHTELAAQQTNDVDLLGQQVARQTERGDSPAQHAARLRMAVEDDDRVAAPEQVVCGRESGGSCADDGHSFPRGFLPWRKVAGSGRDVAIPGQAVKIADRERFSLFAPVAALLAEARADTAERGREGEEVRGNLGGPSEVASRHRGEEARDVEPRRAPGPAGADAVARRDRKAGAPVPFSWRRGPRPSWCARPCRRRRALRTKARASPVPRSAPRTRSRRRTSRIPPRGRAWGCGSRAALRGLENRRPSLDRDRLAVYR